MEEIKEKAEYCLNCKNKPCSIKGCPMQTKIPEFITEIKNENLEPNMWKLMGAGEGGVGRIAHIWPEFLLSSGQADLGGLLALRASLLTSHT